MPKLLIFDIGGVLMDFTEDRYVKYLHDELMPDTDERELRDFIFTLIPLMEYGTLRVPELEHMVAKHFHMRRLDLHWVQGWRRISSPKQENIDLVNALSKTYKVVLLSNVSQSRWAEMKRSYLKLIKVKDIYTSWEIQLRKPEPEVYRYVLRDNEVRPGDAVFVDNQIENVVGAEKEGINAIWFRTYDKLIKDLEKMDVETTDS